MRGFASLDQKASRIEDGIARLQFLRGAAQRRCRRTLTAGRIVRIAAAVSILVFSRQVTRARARVSEPPLLSVQRIASRPSAPPVWLVEDTGARRIYSNGLQVDLRYAAQSETRRYRTWSRDGVLATGVASSPAGIVFHTTESLIVPLEPAWNQALQRTRVDLLEHVRRDRLYNFVIDRFGQVWSVVPESQSAHHAGHSVWADGSRVFVDLNESFLGVSFEAETNAAFSPSAAQVHAGRLLTEMLRSRYEIAEINCVTHAQVSVNPDNMRLGYHTDWASNFPFRDLGLTDGYTTSVAAVAVFGFVWDNHLIAAIGGRPWPGLVEAEEQLQRNAAVRGASAAAYRNLLQRNYWNNRGNRNERTD